MKYVTHVSIKEEKGLRRSKESSSIVRGRQGRGHRHRPFGRLGGVVASIFQ